MLFTQCLLDLMGFLKDDTGKVTCVAGKLKFPFYVQKSKRKNVCQGYMATLRVDKEHFKKKERIRETDVNKEICCWKKAKVSKCTVMNRKF